MKYTPASAYDANTARLQLVVKRNKKPASKKTLYSATIFSTLFFGVALAANLFML